MSDTRDEVRLFLEGVSCDLLLFEHLAAGLSPDQVRIHQEVRLGSNAFADIEVRAGSRAPYFVEIDVGYSRERVLESVTRKYARETPAPSRASKLILVVDAALLDEPLDLATVIRAAVRPGIEVEIWTERQLIERLAKRFGVVNGALTDPSSLIDIRHAIDRAKGAYAFGDGFANGALEEGLLWQLAFWRVHRLCQQGEGIRERSWFQACTRTSSWCSRTSAPTRVTSATLVMTASCGKRSPPFRPSRDTG